MDEAGSRLSGNEFESVLAAARTGAAWALDRLYRQLAGQVMAYLRLQGAEDPEDLSSEVFLGAFRALGRFEGDAPAFRSWLFAIAHRRLVDDRRRRARRPGIDRSPIDRFDRDRSGRGQEQAAPDDTESEVLSSLELERVLRLCERLSPDQRDVIFLRLVADLSVAETATALGKRPGAVKALQHRAVAVLRKELSGKTSVEGVSP